MSTMRKRVIAIDPGLSGAVAVLDFDGNLIDLFDVPVRKDCSKNIVDTVKLWQLLPDDTDGFEYLTVLERVNAMPAKGTANGIPNQGIASTFSFGKSAGFLQAILEAKYTRHPVMVTPVVWKRFHGLLKQPKSHTVFLAREVWPEWERKFLVSKDGRADAALIGHWFINNLEKVLDGGEIV